MKKTKLKVIASEKEYRLALNGIEDLWNARALEAAFRRS